MKAKILVIEDSIPQGEHLQRTLERLGYCVEWATSGAAGLRAARAGPPDLVLLDIVMADIDGMAVCRWLKLHEETRDTPVIMLTARAEVSDRVEGLHVGADDYLVKPFADEELEARIYAALRVQSKAESLRRRAHELESMLRDVEALAVTDPLTGLFNRRRFDALLQREWKLTERYGKEMSCIMVDIDRFKQINDTYGHEIGDDVLREVASLLASTLREVDHIARIGGEEFAILTPHTPKREAFIAAERIRGLIHEHTFVLEGATRQITASFGVADTHDASGAGGPALLRAADLALMRAKQRGRDRVMIFDPSMTDRSDKNPE